MRFSDISGHRSIRICIVRQCLQLVITEITSKLTFQINFVSESLVKLIFLSRAVAV